MATAGLDGIKNKIDRVWRWTSREVGKGPTPEVGALLNHLVGGGQKSWWHGKPKRVGGF